MINKLVLGSAQWGIRYGINNTNGIPSTNSLNEILKISIKNNITHIDTASSYGDAEERIGKIGKGCFNIITKIGNNTSDHDIKEFVKNSIIKTKSSSLYACLFHNYKDLINKPFLWDDLILAKKEGFINKIGFSLYHPDELKILLELNFFPDIIQVPYNLLDRKFESDIERLSKKGVEIHVRSIFLQGLLLNKKLRKKIVFNNEFQIWNYFDKWLLENKFSPLEACISHVNSNKFIDKIIIGVENPNQLSEIINAFKIPAKAMPRPSVEFNEELFNPSKWK